MRHQWLAYVIVALLAIGAGVAIAGLPDTNADDGALVVTATSGPTETSDPSFSTTEPPTATASATTDAPAPTTVAPTTAAPTTAAPTTEPDPSIPDRADIAVVIANGSGLSGSAARNAERLAAIGYENVRLRNGTQIFEFTTIFYADGFEEAAIQLAADLELLTEFVAPLAEAPAVVELPDDVELLAYIGSDRG
jgi:hypothetical protein